MAAPSTSSRSPQRARRRSVTATARPVATGEIRDGFKFRGGRLALDLPATLTGRLRDEPTELLREPGDLGRWLVAAGLAARDPGVTGDELARARALREALYRAAVGGVRGKPPSPADRALINQWAALPTPAPQLSGDGEITWIGNGAVELLASVARDAVELLGGPGAARLRACEGDGCSVVFFDTSRAGRRRWCSMAACGNRAKVSEFRRRARDG